MPKEAVFTMKIEPELREAFMAEAEASHRPASQIVRELMRGYVEKRKEEREYDDYVRRKVAKAMESVEAGQGRSNEEVNADFARWRAERLRRMSGENV